MKAIWKNDAVRVEMHALEYIMFLLPVVIARRLGRWTLLLFSDQRQCRGHG